MLGAVSQRREVGDHAQVPEDERDREVRADREDVPQQWAAEVRPHLHLVREREHPIGEPGTADMDSRERSGANDGEDGHRFGRPVDTRSPFLAAEKQDGGDQRPGMPDTNPENEVDDRVSIARYTPKNPRLHLFGGLLKTPPEVILNAPTIKIPTSILHHFTEKYIECLQEVDQTFEIYDEEIVLSIMNKKYPELFFIVN